MGRGILGSVFSGMWSLPALMAVDVCRCKAAFVIGLNVEISFELFCLSLRHKHQAILFGYCFIIYLQYFIYIKKKNCRVCTLILDHPQLYCMSCI